VNHDGKADLIVSDRVNDVEINMSRGDGTFRTPVDAYIYEGLAVNYLGSSASYLGIWKGGNDVFSIDLNGDGNIDILLDNALLLGNGDGTFQAPQYLRAGPPNVTLVYAGDLNRDGKPDLVFLNAGGITPSQTATGLEYSSITRRAGMGRAGCRRRISVGRLARPDDLSPSLFRGIFRAPQLYFRSKRFDEDT
jgi:hypothetical protein